MPAAKKATKASQTKTRKAKKASPGAKAKKAPVKLMGKAPAKGQGPKGVVAFKKTKPPAGEPRNVILELWKAKEEKRRNETPHLKFQETGPPGRAYASHHKHDSFARFSGPRRRAS